MSNGVERFSALAGVLAVVLWVVGVAIIGGGHVGLPGGLPEEGADEVLAHFRENEDAVVSGGWLFMLGSLAFLWFVGILRARLVAAEGGTGTFAAIAFAGGVATAIFALGIPSGGVVAALGVDEIGAAEAAALNALESAFFIGAELSAIVLLAATAVVALRTAVLPRWWAALSIALAVWLVIGPIGWVGLLAGLPVWTAVTSLMLVQPSAAGRRVKPPVTAAISALAALFVLGVTAAPALAQSYTLNLSGPSTAAVGEPSIFQASGSNPPDDFFSSWLDVAAIPTSVLPACPSDYLNANQIARSSYAQGGEVVVTSQRENVDAAGNFSLPFGYTPTEPGQFLLCGYTNDGATWTHATASRTVNVQDVSSRAPAPAPAPRTGTPKPVNAKKPRVTRSTRRLTCKRGRWSNVPTRFSYRWLVNGRRKRGASGRRLALTRALRGRTVRCKVTASNVGGSTTATSRPLRLR